MELTSELQPYSLRIFLAANDNHVKNLIDLLKNIYNLQHLEVSIITLKLGNRQEDFQCLVVKDLPPIYLIMLENSAVGPRRIKTVFDLVAYSGGSPAIIYVHNSAMTSFKLSVLHNFPIVLFHTKGDFERYFREKYLGDDDREVMFVLKQKQDYVMNKIVFREGPKEKPDFKVVRIVKRENSDEINLEKTSVVVKPTPVASGLEVLEPIVRFNRQVFSPPPVSTNSPIPKVVKDIPKKHSWTLPSDAEQPEVAASETLPVFQAFHSKAWGK